jgi:hypothetical protein
VRHEDVRGHPDEGRHEAERQHDGSKVDQRAAAKGDEPKAGQPCAKHKDAEQIPALGVEGCIDERRPDHLEHIRPERDRDEDADVGCGQPGVLELVAQHRDEEAAHGAERQVEHGKDKRLRGRPGERGADVHTQSASAPVAGEHRVAAPRRPPANRKRMINRTAAKMRSPPERPF